MADIVKSVREAIQDLIAPELREQRGEIKALDTKISTLRSEMVAGFAAADAKMDAKFAAVDAKIGALETKVAAGFQNVATMLENAVLRGEVSTTRELADIRIRLQRLEDQRQEDQRRLQQ